jgi:hypothetical protein
MGTGPRFFVLLAMVASALTPRAGAAELPDGRVYELASPSSMNGVIGSIAYPSPDGNAVDWLGLGGCCGATTGGEQLYQSRRGPEGWTTKGLTPVPQASLEGFTESQPPVFWSEDLGTTIYSTPESYDPGDLHPGTRDLYAQGEDGVLHWVSQGPLGPTGAFESTFDGADPQARVIVFSTPAALTADATGLEGAASPPPQYLYARDLATGTTTLVNVKNDGTLVHPDGAILGDGSYIGHAKIAPNQFGSTTNAVSADGQKVFFESPPPEVTYPSPVPQPHLYMRDLAAGTTTPLDDPSSSGFARYEGASKDGSLVFFRSDEGLGGSAADLELYVFNTTAHQIGVVPAMSVIPVSAGDAGMLDGHLLGISAISNDGSHVYFVAEAVLTAQPNGLGQTAVANEPNFYAFNTSTGTTAFIATLGSKDIMRAPGRPRGPLIRQPDLGRPAVPTPDGSVMVFESKTDLTGENPGGPATELSAEALMGATVIEVPDTAGILAGRQVEIGNPLFGAEKYKVKAVRSGTELELETPIRFPLSPGEPVVQLEVAEIYRYVVAGGGLTCVSCLGVGVRPIEASALTGVGGSYAPANLNTTMNAAGSQIFFMSPEVLLPAASGPAAMHVYEWEDGHLYLLSEPHATESAFVFGSTPSGDDVFLTTGSQLVPEAEPGHLATYDVRVAGGFASHPGGESCGGEGCPRAQATPGPIPAPQTTGLIESEKLRHRAAVPSFRLKAPSRAQRARFARIGRLALRVTAAAPGRAVLRAFAPLGPAPTMVGSAHVAFTHGRLGKTVTLPLSAAARERLDAGSLSLTIEVRDLKTGEVAIKRIDLGGRARGGRR